MIPTVPATKTRHQLANSCARPWRGAVSLELGRAAGHEKRSKVAKANAILRLSWCRVCMDGVPKFQRTQWPPWAACWST